MHTSLALRLTSGFFTIFLVSAAATTARAQTPSAAASSTPAAAPSSAPAPATATPSPAPATPAATPATASGSPASAQPEEDPGSKARFRFAVHLLGGPWFVPSRTGGGGGAGLQLGVQLNDMFGVYYSGTGAIGVAGSSGAAGSGASAGAFVYNSVMGDVTLANILQIGAGPSLDTLAFGSSDINTSSGTQATALGGTFFGVQTRVGIAVGGSKPGRHGRFMLGLEIHPTFASGIVPISAFLTIGGGSF